MSLLLDLSQFRGGVDRVERHLPVHAFGPDETFRVTAPVAFASEVRKDAEKVRLVGRLSTNLELECGRCLESFAVPVDTTFDLVFLPESEEPSEDADRELGIDDAVVSYYRDDTIQLGDVVREQLYLSLPMKPLCRDDCKGLCQVCGCNRNRETCSCETAWVDPRMEPLRRLRSR